MVFLSQIPCHLGVSDAFEQWNGSGRISCNSIKQVSGRPFLGMINFTQMTFHHLHGGAINFNVIYVRSQILQSGRIPVFVRLVVDGKAVAEFTHIRQGAGIDIVGLIIFQQFENDILRLDLISEMFAQKLVKLQQAIWVAGIAG